MFARAVTVLPRRPHRAAAVAAIRSNAVLFAPHPVDAIAAEKRPSHDNSRPATLDFRSNPSCRRLHSLCLPRRQSIATCRLHYSPSSVFAKRSVSRVTNMETYPPLNRISREDLAELLISQHDAVKEHKKPDQKIAVVDVRDSDYIGGHLTNALHRPSSTFKENISHLIVELQPYDTVVFHCALSQQRGPSAALAYMREKAHIENKKRISSSEEDELLYNKIRGDSAEQKVFVLDGGFAKWQEKYGEDGRLTEGYQKDIWGLNAAEYGF